MISNELLISIIVPVYNSEKTISQCLESLLLQTYKNIEIIVVDDGSTDSSVSIILAYAEKNHQIKLFKQSNFGASSARNLGLRESSGDYIMFVDSDDWVENNCVEIALNAVGEYMPDVVMWNLIIERKTESKINIPLKGSVRVFDKKDIDYLFGLMLTYETEEKGMTNISLAGPVCKMYLKSSLDTALFPEHIDLGEDLLFNLKVFDSINKIVYIDAPLYHYVIGDNSLTNKTDLEYAIRKARFVNQLNIYLDNRENKLTKEANVAAYKNYLTVIEKYLFIFKGMKYKQRVKCIKQYTFNLNRKINYSKIGGLLSFFVKNGFFFLIYLFGKLSRKYSKC